MSNQLTFITEAEAIAAEKQVWVNSVKQRASEGTDLVGDGETHYTGLSGLTDEQISQLKIYSSNDGVIDPSLPGTTKYATVKKAYQLTKWYFTEPVAGLMTGVTGHTVEAYDTVWEEPE